MVLGPSCKDLKCLAEEQPIIRNAVFINVSNFFISASEKYYDPLPCPLYKYKLF